MGGLVGREGVGADQVEERLVEELHGSDEARHEEYRRHVRSKLQVIESHVEPGGTGGKELYTLEADAGS